MKKLTFNPEKAFISTGSKKGFYTLKLWGSGSNGNSGSVFVQNLSTDLEKAFNKAMDILDKRYPDVPFDPTVDFDLIEFERRNEEENNINEIEKARAKKADFSDLEGQELALAMIRSGENVFVTGSGGVGKSYVVNQVMEKGTILCAPSGIAALNIGGSTCHRVFKLPFGVVLDRDYNINEELKSLLKKTKRIIIDEISMLRMDLFELIEWKCREATGKDKPFGGIQVVVVGDFYQLPPVVTPRDSELYYELYPSRFCFHSEAWDTFETISLEKVYRQSDERQIRVLNRIRKKENHKGAIGTIQKCATGSKGGIHLCATNAAADRVNKSEFAKLNTPIHNFQAYMTGNWSTGDMPVDPDLDLREGAKVVICANDQLGKYVNGTQGIIKRIGNDKIIVSTNLGDVSVAPFKWERQGYKRNSDGVVDRHTEATFEQYPLKLGWAITIHKSQGMTLESATIAAGGACFEHGQLYVALSRVKNLKNLSFTMKLLSKDVIVSEEVQDFYEGAYKEVA